MLLSEAWKLYEVDKQLLGYSHHTLRGYKIQSNLLIRHFGDVDFESITFLQLKQYLVSQNHLMPSSIGHRVRFIKSMWKWAQDEGYITGNPAAKLREPRLGMRLPKALSDEDTETLREGCEDAREHALVEFLYTTGCRIGEVYQINRHDINWENRSIVVNGKGSKEREVYFSIKASIWLKKYLKSRVDDNPALFVTINPPNYKVEKPPRRLSIGQMRYILKKVAERSGVETKIYPHKMRHSYATHLLNNGAPLEIIQSLLGHSKMETTRIYAHLSGERRRQDYNRYFR